MVVCMSMNLHVHGKRDVTVNKTGKQSIQFVGFNLWQTPTMATRQILATDNPAQAYRDWVNSDRYEYEEPVYADDDYLGEGEPIGTKIVCNADYHLANFDKFIKECEDDGYELEFYEL